MIKYVKIVKYAFPVDGYRFDVQIWRSLDGGKTYWHCGCGKMFRELWQALQYKRAIEA